MSRAYDFAETKILYMLYGYVYHLCKCNLIVILRGFLMGLSSITKHFAEVGWVWKSSMFLILQFLFPQYEFWQSRLEFFLPWLHTWNMIAIIKTSISTKFIRSHQYLSDTNSCFFFLWLWTTQYNSCFCVLWNCWLSNADRKYVIITSFSVLNFLELYYHPETY